MVVEKMDKNRTLGVINVYLSREITECVQNPPEVLSLYKNTMIPAMEHITMFWFFFPTCPVNSDEDNYCTVIRDLLQEAVCRVVSEVFSLDGGEERYQTVPCGPPYRKRPRVLIYCGQRWSSIHVVQTVLSCALQLLPTDCGKDWVEGTGAIKEHDSHSAPSSL